MATRKGLRLVAGLFAIVLIAAACSDDKKTTTSSGSAGGKTTYALAFVGPLSGPNANLGKNIRDGAKTAVKEANDAGGNVTFELKEFDTQGDPAQAPTVKDKYINDSSVLGVVGPTFSGETKAVIQAFEDASLVMISASATNTQLPTVVPNSKSFHRLVPDDDVQGQGVTDYVTKKLNAKRAFYINDNSDYGKGLADGTQQTLEKAQVTTVGTDVIDPTADQYTVAVNNAKAANPDLIFYGGYYSQAGKLAKQLKDGGVNAPFMSGDGSLDPGFIAAGGTEGSSITCACKLATADEPGALGAFAKKYKEVTGNDPGTYSTEGYDATKIEIDGILKGNTTRAKLRDYVNALGKYTGVSKVIEFESNGNVKAGDVFVYQVKSGKLSELGTIDEVVGN